MPPAVPASSVAAEQRFQHDLDRPAAVLGHADRHEPLRLYTTGLLLPGERKSIEPLAARVEPQRVGARHQSLHHFAAGADWDDTAVLAAVREQVLPALERHGPITAGLGDDTGLPPKGTHSVGVAPRWCGPPGKQAHCPVAVSLSGANDIASLPLAWRLDLPPDWATAAARHQKTGVPPAAPFQTGHELALAQVRPRPARNSGVSPWPAAAHPAAGRTTPQASVGAISSRTGRHGGWNATASGTPGRLPALWRSPSSSRPRRHTPPRCRRSWHPGGAHIAARDASRRARRLAPCLAVTAGGRPRGPPWPRPHGVVLGQSRPSASWCGARAPSPSRPAPAQSW